MNNSTVRTVFPRQLRFWTFHCAINALPSLCIALVFLRLWKSPPAVAAMICAIATFILLYATLTSLNGPLANESHLLARSLKLGAKIRAWISGLSLFLLSANAAVFTPDFWCGFLASGLLYRADQFFNPGSNTFDLVSVSRSAATIDFFPIYVTTLLEGIILTFLLLMISFFAVMFLQARDRRKFFALADPR